MTPFLLPAATTLLLLFLSPLPATSTATTGIVDIDGDGLLAGEPYYILPVVRGRGGGLTMRGKNSTLPCPLYAAQEEQEVSQGLPIKFYPTNSKRKPISEFGLDLNFVFDVDATICIQSTGWSLTFDEETGRWYVGTGGEIGNPGKETFSNWFKIEDAGSGDDYNHYKIVFCPGVCDICRPVCGEIGVFIEEDGRRLLGLRRDEPLLVMFKKAQDQDDGTRVV